MRRANVGSDTGSIVVFLLKMDLPARTNAVRGQHIDFHISKGLISNSDLKSTHTQRVGGRERRVGEEEGEVKREREREGERGKVEGRERGRGGEEGDFNVPSRARGDLGTNHIAIFFDTS